MYRILAFLAVLCCGGPLLAASGVDTRPSDARLRQEATNYAQQLHYTVNEVAQGYVREVSRTDLFSAALAGLYEAARQPIPANLQTDFERAKDTASQLALIIRIRESLGDVEPLRGTNALLVSFQAMTKALDPHSLVVDAQELRRTVGENVNYGVGLDFVPSTGGRVLQVQSVKPGSPAQQAGIRPGDRITHVNGDSVDGQPSVSVLQRLNGTPGGREHSSELTVQRVGEKDPRQVRVPSQHFKTEAIFGVSRKTNGTWNYYLDRERKLAQVRVGYMDQGTGEELREVLSNLKAEGMRGLILDLRWCPGGFLNESVFVARLLLKQGLVAKVHYRNRQQDEDHRVTNDSGFADFPLVVLINSETSGGAELIAAAVQDNQRGKVAGERSRGKGSVQTMLYLPVNGMGMRLTSGTFLRPNGKNLHRFPDSKPADDWGVRPDPRLEFPMTPDLSNQLRDWWLLQTLRPGRSTEALPLDDPDKDPLRQSALQTLIAMLK